MDYQITSELIGGIAALALVTGIGISNHRKNLNAAEKNEAKYTQLKTRFNELNKDNKNFTEALTLAKEAVTTLEQKLSEAGEAAAQERSELEQKLQDRQQLEAELTEARQRLETLHSEAIADGQTVTQLKNQLETERKTLQRELAAANQTKAEQAATHQKKQAEMLATTEQIKRQVAELTEQKAALQKMLDAKTAGQALLSAEQKTLRTQISELEQQCRQLLQASQANGSLPKMVSNPQVEDLKTQIASLKQERDHAQQTAETAQTQAASLEKALQALQADKVSLEEAMKISQKAIMALQEQIATPKKQSISPAFTQSTPLARTQSLTATAQPEPTIAAGSAIRTDATTKESKQKSAKPKEDTKAEADPFREMFGNVAFDGSTFDEAAFDGSAFEDSSFEEAALEDAIGGAIDEMVFTAEAFPSGKFRRELSQITGKSFVLTGKLTHLTNEEWAAAIEQQGGRINKIPSSQTDYIVVGENPGNTLIKAEKCNIAQLSEAELIALLEKTQ